MWVIIHSGNNRRGTEEISWLGINFPESRELVWCCNCFSALRFAGERSARSFLDYAKHTDEYIKQLTNISVKYVNDKEVKTKELYYLLKILGKEENTKEEDFAKTWLNKPCQVFLGMSPSSFMFLDESHIDNVIGYIEGLLYGDPMGR